MSNSPEARLQRLLGGDHLASLRKRLRQRFERAPLDAPIEVIRIGKLTSDERAALTSLLGRAPHYSNSLTIDVRLVDAALQRSGIATSLRHALEQLDGPIVHLATARLKLQALWSESVDSSSHPGLKNFLQTSAGISLIKRLAKQDPPTAVQLCRRVEAVLERLPANGVTRSQLAADVLGDAHALDNGQATATIVLAIRRQMVLSASDRIDAIEPADDEVSKESGSAERDRDIWAGAGILVNELARPVLFLNLPTKQAESYGRPRGEPIYASLRSLLRSPPPWDVAARKVYVCENPNLLAIAADHWGSDCAPLVCTDGMPAAAQRCLLSQLAKARAQLCYHGDFDWPGLRIGNHVMREHGAHPWRFSADDYATAVHTISGLGQTLTGKTVDALWDKALTILMQKHRLSIPEEALAASLLRDLDTR